VSEQFLNGTSAHNRQFHFIFRWTWVNHLPLNYLPLLVSSRRECLDTWHRYLQAICPSYHATNSFKAHRETKNQWPVIWPYHFFIHYQTPEERGISSFMPTLLTSEFLFRLAAWQGGLRHSAQERSYLTSGKVSAGMGDHLRDGILYT